ERPRCGLEKPRVPVPTSQLHRASVLVRIDLSDAVGHTALRLRVVACRRIGHRVELRADAHGLGGCPLNSGHAAIPLRDVRDTCKEAPNLLGLAPDHDPRFEVHRFLSARCNPSESARTPPLSSRRGWTAVDPWKAVMPRRSAGAAGSASYSLPSRLVAALCPTNSMTTTWGIRRCTLP